MCDISETGTTESLLMINKYSINKVTGRREWRVCLAFPNGKGIVLKDNTFTDAMKTLVQQFIDGSDDDS